MRLSQVVGLPDAQVAEMPAAFVESEGPFSCLPEDFPSELTAFVSASIASFKAPRQIRLIDEWPTSASKIQKFKLRQQLIAELGIGE